MRKRKKNSKYLLIVLFGTTFICMLYYFLNNNTKLDNLKSLSANLLNTNTKIDTKEVVNAEIDDLNKEIEELKKLNKLDQVLTDKIVVSASIIKRSTPYWHNIITINKGKKNGIKKGYAVMSADGYLGEVDIVNNNTSEIKLITNSNKNNLSAKFNYEGKDYFGIIKKYDVITGELNLESVIGNFDKDKVKNLYVVTSGLSSNMPSGLLIGKIKEVKKDKYNLSSTIIIKMSANINDISVVKVVGEK